MKKLLSVMITAIALIATASAQTQDKRGQQKQDKRFQDTVTRPVVPEQHRPGHPREHRPVTDTPGNSMTPHSPIHNNDIRR